MRLRSKIWRHRLLRTVVLAGGLALALVVVLRLLAPVMVSAGMVRESMEQAVEAWLGHDVVIEGTPELEFWPQPMVTLTGITIRMQDAPDAPVLGRIEALSAQFSLWPALRGRPVFQDFHLERPQVTLKIDQQDETNWSSEGRLAAAVQAAGRGVDVRDAATPETVIGDVTITRGTLRIEASHGRELTLENITGTIDWPRLSAPARMKLRTDVRGERLELDVGSPEPLMLLGGLGTELTASVKSNLFSGSFSGRADLATYTFLSGDLQLSIPDVKRVVDWAGLPVHTADRLNNVSLSAQLVTLEKVLRFDRLAISANGTRGNGVMDLTLARADKPPRVSGTLAFDTLDLRALVLAIAYDRQKSGPGGMALRTPLERQLGFDVRFSAGQAQFGAFSMTNAAVSVVSNGQKAEVEVLDSDLLGGSLTGKVRLDLAAGPRTTIHLAGRDLDFAPIAKDMLLHGPVLLGPVSVDLDATLSRPLAEASAADLAGSLHLQAANGRIPELDLDAMRRLAAGSSYFTLQQAGDADTDFDTLDVRADFAQGSADIRAARLETRITSLSLTGVVPYLTRSLSLAATLEDKAGALAPVNLFVGGAWPDPVIWPASTARTEASQP
jgi:AsmA protein